MVVSLLAAWYYKPMYNDSVEHAVIILQNIFLHAHHSVKILTGELNPEAYARRGIVEDVKHFIEDDRHNLQILFEMISRFGEGPELMLWEGNTEHYIHMK